MELHNPANLPQPKGFSHVSVVGPGRLILVAGQVGQNFDGTYPEDLVEQFRVACENVAKALAAAGANSENVVSLQIFTTEIGTYRGSLGPIGEAYRSIFGKHFPPTSLLGISELFDSAAKVELVAMAFLEHDSTD